METLRFISYSHATYLCRISKPIFSINLSKCATATYKKDLKPSILCCLSQHRNFSSRFNRQVIQQHLGTRHFILLFPVGCTCVLVYVIFLKREQLQRESLRLYDFLYSSLKKLVEQQRDQFLPDETREVSTSQIEPTMSLDKIAENALSSIVYIEAVKCQLMSLFTLVLNERLGFVYKHNGLVVTDSSIRNRGNPKDFRVTFNDGRSFIGSIPLEGNLRIHGDLCLIELQEAHNLSPLKLSPKNDNLEGKEVIMYRINRSNVSSSDDLGIVHERAEVYPYQQEKKKTDVVNGVDVKKLQLLMLLNQTMETLWRVNVPNLDDTARGSPVIDQSGNVVGVVKRIITNGAVISSLNTTRNFLTKFCSSALPFSVIQNVGLSFVPLNPLVVHELKRINKDSQLDQLNFVHHGHLVHTVIKGSLGHKYGIKPGDVITHVNNQPIVTPTDVFMKLKSDRQATLRIRRGHAVQDIIFRV